MGEIIDEVGTDPGTERAGRPSDLDVVRVVEQYRHTEARLQRRRQSRACGPSDTDREALVYIFERADEGEPTTPKQLAAALEMTTASVTALVDRLTGVGLVSRVPHPDDRRSTVLLPTDRSRDPHELDPLSLTLAELARDLPPHDAQVVAGFLARLSDAVDAECR